MWWKPLLVLALWLFALWCFVGWLANRNPPYWDGLRYSCPVGYDIYADEHEARQHKQYVHCVKEVR